MQESVEVSGSMGTHTGDPSVDAALTTLRGLADRPLREHVVVFDGIQGALSDRLAETRE